MYITKKHYQEMLDLLMDAAKRCDLYASEIERLDRKIERSSHPAGTKSAIKRTEVKKPAKKAVKK